MNIEILDRYEKQKRRLSKLFVWLDENEISLTELAKDDLTLYFKVSKQARNTGKYIKTALKQVLVGEGLPYEWVQTVVVPFESLYLSLDDILKDIDDYARGFGTEKYKIEADGFNSVKAAVILLWLGISVKDAGYILKEDVYDNRILFMGVEYPFIGNISGFIDKYKKSDGYWAGERPNLKFKFYKDNEYFLRTTKRSKNPTSRDNMVERFFEKLTDLDISINSIQKAGLFDRAYNMDKEILISENLSEEYNEYKKKRKSLILA